MIRSFKISSFLLALWVCLPIGLAQSVDTLNRAQLRAEFDALSDPTKFEVMDSICRRIMHTTQQFGLKHEEAYATANMGAIVTFEENPGALAYWIDSCQHVLQHYEGDLRYTLLDSVRFLHAFNQASYYKMIGDLNSAKPYYLWMWNEWSQRDLGHDPNHTYSEIHFFTDVAMRWMARLAMQQGRYRESAQALWRSLRLGELETNEESFSFPDQRVTVYGLLGKTLLLAGQRQEAKAAFEKAFSYHAENMAHPDLDDNTASWGFELHLQYAKILVQEPVGLDMAAFHLQEAHTLLSNPLLDEVAKAEYAYVEALFSLKNGDMTKANVFFEEAIAHLQKQSRHEPALAAEIYLAWAKHLKADQPEKALSLMQACLKRIALDFNPTTDQENPAYADVMLKPAYLDVLSLKTSIFMQMMQNDTANATMYFDLARTQGQALYDLIPELLNDPSEELDKSQLLSKLHEGLAPFWATFQYEYERTKHSKVWESLFELQTKIKSLTLSCQITERDRLKAQNWTTKEIQTYFLEKKALADLQKKVFYTATTDANYHSIRLEFSQSLDRFKQLYPSPTTFTFRPASSMDAIRENLLNAHTALLEYTISGMEVYITLLTQNTIETFVLNNYPQLEAEIVALQKILSDHTAMEASGFLDFSRLSGQLFQSFLLPALSQLSSDIDQIIVIPDGALASLPFEVLGYPSALTQDYQHFPYLLRDYTVSYGYSTEVLCMQQLPASVSPPLTFLAFAPSYPRDIAYRTRGDTEQSTLPGAEREALFAAKVFGGEVVFGQAANLENLISRIDKYRILLFAMHALADVENPQKARFLLTHEQDQTLVEADLTAAEIAQMRLSTALVVLSACQTGVGRHFHGEGVYSLSRSFVSAGAKSVMMSLWNLSDATTPLVMAPFYNSLRQGNNKAAALRNAKLQYLQTSDEQHEYRYHPFFWAGIVLTGATAPMTF